MRTNSGLCYCIVMMSKLHITFLWCCLACVWEEASGFQWTDNVTTELSTCVGEPAEIQWNYELDGNTENFISISWHFQGKGENQDLMTERPQDFKFGRTALESNETAALTLISAVLSDAGTYSVNVKYMRATTAGSAYETLEKSRSVNLRVSDAPSTSDGSLRSTLNDKPVKIQTGDTSAWRIKLSCGTFTSLGYPPVNVKWTTPSGETLPSTSYENGVFHLIPDHMETGEFICQIDPKEPAVACLDNTSTLHQTASLFVDGIDVRLSLLEARDADLEERINMAAKSVSFHSQMNGGPYSDGETLSGETISTNDGDAYNKTSGVFTAPVNGTYMFLVTAMVSSKSPRKINDGVYIYVDGSYASKCWSSYVNRYEPGSCHAILKLKAGQRVWLYNRYDNSRYYWDVTTFSGALLHADLS